MVVQAVSRGAAKAAPKKDIANATAIGNIFLTVLSLGGKGENLRRARRARRRKIHLRFSAGLAMPFQARPIPAHPARRLIHRHARASRMNASRAWALAEGSNCAP